MARIRDPNRDAAHEIYKSHNGDITNRAIAEQLEVDEKKVAVWKSRDKWNVVQQTDNKTKSVVQQKKKQTKSDKIIDKAVERIDEVQDSDFTDKQRLFIGFYLKCWNATKAYQKAYGCAYSTAMVEGHRLLRNPKIAAELQKTRDEIFAESFLSSKAIIQKYMDIAFADITDFATWNKSGTYMRVKSDSEVDGSLISEISNNESGMKIKLLDRMKALDKLDKYMNLMSEEDRLRLDKLRVDIDKAKLDIKIRAGEDEEEVEDDGFLAALEGKVSEVWADEE
ncbi:MAG TPA: terminase small subunit [Candidatus Paenibacillus intestinavium]|nr:terminase small subunit [Candidatus Paenibacillus intestinavium]